MTMIIIPYTGESEELYYNYDYQENGDFVKSILREFKIKRKNMHGPIANMLLGVRHLDDLVHYILLEPNKKCEIFNVSIPCCVCGIMNSKIKYYLHDRTCDFAAYKDTKYTITCEKCTFGTSKFDIHYALLSSDEYKEIPNTPKKYQSAVRKMINKLNVSKCNVCGYPMINSAKCNSAQCGNTKTQKKYNEMIGNKFRDILIIMIQNSYFKEAYDIFQSIVHDIGYDECEEILECVKKYSELYYMWFLNTYELKEDEPIFKRCYPKHLLHTQKNLKLYAYDQYTICKFPLSILKNDDLQKIIDVVFSNSINVYDKNIRHITDLFHIQFCSTEYYQYVASNWLKYESNTRQFVASLILLNTYQTTSREILCEYKKNCPTKLQWSEAFKMNIDTQYKKICYNIEILSNTLEDVMVLDRIESYNNNDYVIVKIFNRILDKNCDIKKTIANCTFMDFDDPVENFDTTLHTLTYIEIIDIFEQIHKYVDVISPECVKLLPFKKREKLGVFTKILTTEEQKKIAYLQSQLWFIDWLKDLKGRHNSDDIINLQLFFIPAYVWKLKRLSDDYCRFSRSRPPRHDYFEDLIQ